MQSYSKRMPVMSLLNAKLNHGCASAYTHATRIMLMPHSHYRSLNLPTNLRSNELPLHELSVISLLLRSGSSAVASSLSPLVPFISEATASCQYCKPVLLTSWGLRISPKYLSGLVVRLAPPSRAEIADLVVRRRFPFLPPSLRRLLSRVRSSWSLLSHATIDLMNGAISTAIIDVVLSNTEASR